jgi:hypothetical protein
MRWEGCRPGRAARHALTLAGTEGTTPIASDHLQIVNVGVVIAPSFPAGPDFELEGNFMHLNPRHDRLTALKSRTERVPRKGRGER